MARRYSKKASTDVRRAMKKRKAGTLKSGRSGRKVKSRKQAIAIGLSEARAKGKKVPKKAAKKRKTAKKKTAKKSKKARRYRARSLNSVMPGQEREARLRADVPGIHVLFAGEEGRRGWPGQARP